MKNKVKEYIFDYHKKNGVYPSVKIIASGCQITTEEVRQAFEELARDGVLNKYPKRPGEVSSYHVPRHSAEREIEKKPLFQEGGIVLPVGNNIKITPPRLPNFSIIKPEKLSIIEIFVRAVMGVIAIGAIAVSCLFSWMWTSTFLPAWIAIVLSASIPAYIAFAPEGALLILESSTDVKRNSKRRMPAAGKILLITAGLALAFSMCMTIIGQFNQRAELLKIKNVESKVKTTNFEKLEILKKDETMFFESMGRLKSELFELQKSKKEIQKIEKEDKRNLEIKKVDAEIQKIKTEIKNYEGKIEKNRENQKVLFESGIETKEERHYNFYVWVESVTNIPAGVVEFVLYIIPALFCDIIAPLGIFVAVGLYRKRKNEKV